MAVVAKKCYINISKIVLYEFYSRLFYQNCEDYYNDGITLSGNYSIDPDLDGPIIPFAVYCDFETSINVYLLN